ncbi:MAG TPA: hypothetical protein VNJ03_15380 [Vicinamibacterales bacterium]|nr:hypothetical protein [Vicinamibacterales bacterium]
MGLKLPSVLLLICTVVTAVAAEPQVGPQPFPRPGPSRPSEPAAAQPPSASPIDAPLPQDASQPADGSLGVPIYPSAQYITSYNAGRGQRYYLYGTTATFAEIVQYYKTTLRQRGDQVFDQPPLHQFDLGKFREETMAFQPSVTVKDYTWGGTAGYLNPKRGGEPARFPTIIQVVPNPPGVPR